MFTVASQNSSLKWAETVRALLLCQASVRDPGGASSLVTIGVFCHHSLPHLIYFYMSLVLSVENVSQTPRNKPKKQTKKSFIKSRFEFLEKLA